MPFKPKKTKRLAEELIKKGVNLKEVQKQTGYSMNNLRRIRHKIRGTTPKKYKPRKPKAIEHKELPSESLTIEQIPPAKPPPELEEIEPTVEVTDELREKVKLAITSKHIVGMYQAVNEALPKQYQRSKAQLEILGELGEAPLNRLMEKYIDENVDLYIFLAANVVIWLPVPLKYLQQRQKKKPKPKEEKPKSELPATT